MSFALDHARPSDEEESSSANWNIADFETAGHGHFEKVTREIKKQATRQLFAPRSEREAANRRRFEWKKPAVT
jgi:hypothetical protein